MNQRHLGPTGAGSLTRTLPDDAKEHIRTLLASQKKGISDEARSTLMPLLDQAFAQYFSTRELDQKTRLPTVRAELEAAGKAASKFLEKLKAFNGNTRNLMDEQAPQAHRKACNHVSSALSIIKETRRVAESFSNTRPVADFAKEMMVLAIRFAMEEAGLKATTTKKSRSGGLFDGITSVLVWTAEEAVSGERSGDYMERDVQRLTRQALKGTITKGKTGTVEFVPASAHKLNTEK